MKLSQLLSCVAAFALVIPLVTVIGCSKPAAEGSASTTAVTPPTSAVAPDAAVAPVAANKPAQDMASCPVLGTTMPKSKMIPLNYQGKTYYFCCSGCVTQFKADPQKYIKHPAKPLPPGAGMQMP